MIFKKYIFNKVSYALALLLLSAASFASPLAASCSVDGNFNKSGGTCSSYVCCSGSGSEGAGWVAGVAESADQWCAGNGSHGSPATTCTSSSNELNNKMSLQALTLKSASAGGYSASGVSCKYDTQCIGD